MSKMQSPSFERNQATIWDAIGQQLAALEPPRVLELACGSGQHAAAYVPKLPDVQWQSTDGSAAAVASAAAWRAEGEAPSWLAPLHFDVGGPAPEGLQARSFGGALAFNFLHMVQLDLVERTFTHLAALLANEAKVFVYDCFTYGGEHVSASNLRFDGWLKERGGAVHAFEDVDRIATSRGFSFTSRQDLPANNQMTIWTRSHVEDR